MRSLLLISILLISYSAIFAQIKEPEASNAETAVALSKTIKPADLEKHLTILASDEYEGRETGQKGQKMAAEYIKEHFKSIGMKEIPKLNGYFQEIPLIKESWGDQFIKVDTKEYQFLEDYYCFSRTVQEMDVTVNEVVFAGYGIEDENYNDYKGIDVKDKIVVVLKGEPKKKDGTYYVSGNKEESDWSGNWRSKIKKAKEKEAKAIFIVTPNIKKDINFFKYAINSNSMRLMTAADTDDSPYVNTFYISGNMALDLLKMSSKKFNKYTKKVEKKGARKPKLVKKAVNIKVAKETQKLSSENVLGFIEGVDPNLKDEVLVITSHYDHLGVKGDKIYNGADDDGSGTVALLELAEAFAFAKESGNGPRRSILFMPVSGEEKGLLGSEHYANNPVFPLENTIADLNIDMVGRVDEAHEDDPNYVYVIGSDRLSTELHAINESANRNFTKLNLDYKYNAEDDPNQFYYRSDHYNFAKNNIPVIFYFNGTHDEYHQPTDTVEKINFELLAKRTQLIFFTAWQLVNQNKRIEVDVTE